MKRRIILNLLLLTLTAKAQTEATTQPSNIRVSMSGSTPESVEIIYDSEAQNAYFVEMSFDLDDWAFIPEIKLGDGTEQLFEYSVNQPKAFFRLYFAEATSNDPESEDFDGDGLTNIQELTHIQQTSPFSWDTDNDSFSDKWEIDFGFDPLSESSGVQASTYDVEGDLLINHMESLIGSNPNVEYEVLTSTLDKVFTPN